MTLSYNLAPGAIGSSMFLRASLSSLWLSNRGRGHLEFIRGTVTYIEVMFSSHSALAQPFTKHKTPHTSPTGVAAAPSCESSFTDREPVGEFPFSWYRSAFLIGQLVFSRSPGNPVHSFIHSFPQLFFFRIINSNFNECDLKVPASNSPTLRG